MMNYEIFKEVVKEKFRDYLPEKYRDMELVSGTVNKINVTLDAISLQGKGDMKVSPTLYIDSLYKEYEQTEDLEATLKSAAEGMVKNIEQMPEINTDIDRRHAKNHIEVLY